MNFDNGNTVELVTTLAEFTELLPFFYEGLDAMNNPAKANMCETKETFLKIMLVCCTKFPEAYIFVCRSKNNKLLGYTSGYNGTRDFSPVRSLWIYGTYSNKKNAECPAQMLKATEQFAREQGYDELLTSTGRITSAAKHWFENKMGFKQRFVAYRKELK